MVVTDEEQSAWLGGSFGPPSCIGRAAVCEWPMRAEASTSLRAYARATRTLGGNIGREDGIGLFVIGCLVGIEFGLVDVFVVRFWLFSFCLAPHVSFALARAWSREWQLLDRPIIDARSSASNPSPCPPDRGPAPRSRRNTPSPGTGRPAW